MSTNALLIAGTDTNAGKTVLTLALAAYWQTYCTPQKLGILKPVQSGVGDRELYHQVLNLDQSLEETNPLYFPDPLAPPLAAEKVGQKVDLEKAWKTFQSLSHQKDWVLVEAAGGLGSPITWETTVADLAWDWHLPLILVVPVRLGAIAQAVANAALARQSRIHLKGIVLNCLQPLSQAEIDDWAPMKRIQSLTQVPVLGTIPYLSDPTDLEKLAQIASDLDLERMIPIGSNPACYGEKG